jgi:hypothetical protein
VATFGLDVRARFTGRSGDRESCERELGFALPPPRCQRRFFERSLARSRGGNISDSVLRIRNAFSPLARLPISRSPCQFSGETRPQPAYAGRRHIGGVRTDWPGTDTEASAIRAADWQPTNGKVRLNRPARLRRALSSRPRGWERQGAARRSPGYASPCGRRCPSGAPPSAACRCASRRGPPRSCS